MSFTKQPLRLLALAALPLLALGCGGQSEDPDTLNRKAELAEIYDMYALYQKNHPTEHPPQGVSDLTDRNDPVHAMGMRVLTNGEYHVVWGLDVRGKDSGRVLAYEKDALTQGGWAVTTDGSIRKMSAEDLKAAIGQ